MEHRGANLCANYKLCGHSKLDLGGQVGHSS